MHLESEKMAHPQHIDQDEHIWLPEYKLSYADPEDALWKQWLIELIEILSGRLRLQALYDEMRARPLTIHTLWEEALNKLNISLRYLNRTQVAIPEKGPTVFIANHPFGIVDGLAFCHIVASRRPQFQIPINSVLCSIESLKQYLLPVNFANSKEAVRMNIETKKRATETLKAGGAIAIFPGGGISTSKGFWGPATDLDWKRFAGALIQQTQAHVVPIYFQGQNSRLFQIVSQFSLTLRLSLLMYEVRRMMGTTLEVHIGEAIPYEELSHLKNRQQLIDHLRAVTYSLTQGKEYSNT